MRVVCRHGHYAFYPHNGEEVLHFRRKYKIMLHPQDDYFTFLGLLNAPRWSQVGRPIGVGGMPALVNFEGKHPSEVFRANFAVYSMMTSTVVPSLTFAAFGVNLNQSRDKILSPKMLLQVGCLYSIGYVPRGVLISYAGEIDLETNQLQIASVESQL